MEKLKPVDVVVIGGGWTALLMAKELTARTGLSVVVLERGPERKLKDYMANMDEVDYSLRFRMLQNISEETITHRHTIKDQAAPVREWGHIRLASTLTARCPTPVRLEAVQAPTSSSHRFFCLKTHNP